MEPFKSRQEVLQEAIRKFIPKWDFETAKKKSPNIYVGIMSAMQKYANQYSKYIPSDTEISMWAEKYASAKYNPESKPDEWVRARNNYIEIFKDARYKITRCRSISFSISDSPGLHGLEIRRELELDSFVASDKPHEYQDQIDGILAEHEKRILDYTGGWKVTKHTLDKGFMSYLEEALKEMDNSVQLPTQ